MKGKAETYSSARTARRRATSEGGAQSCGSSYWDEGIGERRAMSPELVLMFGGSERSLSIGGDTDSVSPSSQPC